MKKYTFLITSVLVAISSCVLAQTGELATIYQRLYTNNYNPNVNSNVTTWVNTLQSNGRWNDLNYNSSKSYSPTAHNQRVRDMALAYVKNVSGNTWYQNATLKQKIILALNDNANRYVYTVFKWSDYSTYNWFDDYVASPSNLVNALVLLNNSFTDAEMKVFNSYVKDYRTIKNSAGNEQFADAGQNLVWISEVSFRKGVLENNSTLTQASMNSIASTINIMTTQGGEGIKIDNMFHQHGAQVYGGGYGLWYVPSILNNMEYVNSTSYNSVFTSTRWNIFRNMLLGGHQWLGYKGNMDFGSMGRNISRPNNTGNIGAGDLDRLAILDPTYASSYQAWKTHRNGGNSAIVGNRHFWNSDMMVHRGTNYYLSAKVISNRTDGTETMNGENLLGYNLPLGATNINTKGSEYNNIYPVWDYSRIPGTTTELNTTYPSPHTFKGTNVFAGGTSNDEAGILSFSSDYQAIKSVKTYIGIEDMMLCLGSGINANKTNNIATSVNQTFLNGNVTISQNDAVLSNEQSLNGSLSWIHHDNVGYVFLNSPTLYVSNKTQTGSWSLINTNGSASSISKQIFSAYIDHGKSPSNAKYAYIIAPNQTVASTKTLANNHNFNVLVNSDSIQAVEYPKLNYTALVFLKPNKLTISNNTEIEALNSSIILLKNDGFNYQISVSDPLYNQNTIKVKINGELVGEGTSYDAVANITTITFNMPMNEYTGQTVTKTFLKKDEWHSTLMANTIKGYKHISYTVFIKKDSTDLVTGFGPNMVTTFDSLATIVRFNNLGKIDVRKGSSYTSDVSFTYTSGKSYQIDMIVNMDLKTYSVYITAENGSKTLIASNYTFRSAQATATKLDYFSYFNSQSDFYTVSEPVYSDWTNHLLIEKVSGLQKVTYKVNPSTTNINLVTGLGPNYADNYDSLAILIRFNDLGKIDVRNGNSYQSITTYTYKANTEYLIEILADMNAKTYDVIITEKDGVPIKIASNYQFRSAQIEAAELNFFAHYSTTKANYSITLPTVTTYVITTIDNNITEYSYCSRFLNKESIVIDKEQEYVIYNLSGQVIYRGNNSEVNITTYPQGIYLIKTNSQTCKFMQE